MSLRLGGDSESLGLRSSSYGLKGSRIVMTTDEKSQRERLLETARELECDEDEDRFNETLRRIAPKKDESPPQD